MEEALRKLVEGSRAESGNVAYELLEDSDDANHLFFLETWASDEALQNHNQTPHFQEFMELARGKTRENRITRLKSRL